ncbi:unnamed protein product, partial [Closterium sp. NIES-54]
MAHAVQAALSLHPDWVVLELDVANAFNSFNRTSMFDALCESPFSSLIPFFHIFYATPSPLHYRNGPILESLQSVSGVRQGDPCGPFLYALTQQLAIHPTRQLHPSNFITSYAYDTYIVDPAPDVYAAYNTLTSRLQPLGLTIQPSKCSLWGHFDVPPGISPPPNIIIAPDGLTVAELLGHFTRLIGTEFWPPEFDHPSFAHLQPFLPIRLGGFGLRSSTGFAGLSFLSSWAQTVPLLASHFLIDGSPIFCPFITTDSIDHLEPCIVSSMACLPSDILSLFPS